MYLLESEAIKSLFLWSGGVTTSIHHSLYGNMSTYIFYKECRLVVNCLRYNGK